MQGFNVDTNKTLNAALYVLNNLGEADYHKTFKILYFAVSILEVFFDKLLGNFFR